MAVFCQTFLNGGGYGSARILSRDSVIAMFANYNRCSPATSTASDGSSTSAGRKARWRRRLQRPHRLHRNIHRGRSDHAYLRAAVDQRGPSQPELGRPNPQRRKVAYALARATAVQTAKDRREWFGGMADRTTNSLVLPITLLTAARVAFELWYDTEAGYDFFYLEVSGNGGTSWQQVPFTIRGDRLDVTTPGRVSGYQGRQWLQASASLHGVRPGAAALALHHRPALPRLRGLRGCHQDHRWTKADLRRPEGT